MKPANRRGTVVVAVVVALVMLQLVVYAVAVGGSREQDLTTRRLEAARTYYAAESVANMAIREIARNSDEDANGTVGAVYSSLTAPAIGPGGGSAWATASTTAGVTTVTVAGVNGLATRTITANVQRVVTAAATQGLFVEMWTATTGLSALSNIPWATTASWATVMPNVNMPSQGSIARWTGGPTGRYGVRFKGNIIIPATGTWNFRISSDDGSDLWINGVRVVNNDGLHGNTARTGSATLTAGTYSFECRMFENGGSSNLWAEWRGPGVASYTLIPSSAFTCSPTVEIPPVAVGTTIGVVGGAGSPLAGIDGFNSGGGAYGGGNILSSGVLVSTNAIAAAQWSVSGNAALTVDGRVGVGGSPGSVISVAAPATMSGTNAALTRRLGPIIQGRPLILPATSGAYSSSSDMTINTDRRYSSFSSSGSATITISGNVSIVIDGALTMSGTSAFVLAPNATLNLYVGGTITLNGDAKINAASQDPTRVNIYQFNTASRDLAMNAQSKVHARVLNPFGRAVLSGTSELFGSFHGNAISITQNGRIHADVAALPTIGAGVGVPSPGQAVVKAWNQTR